MKKKWKKKPAKKPLRYLIPGLTVFGILVIILLAGAYTKRNGDTISSIPMDAVGNTAGNIRGEGRFCEYEGKVYFSNPYDGEALYVMNPNGSEMKRLNANRISYINAGGNHLFYYLKSKEDGVGLGYVRGSTGLYRSTLEGSATTCLDKHMLTMMVLAGDQVYYQHYDNTNFSAFYKVSALLAYGETELNRENIETAHVVNGKIYYGGLTNDHYLHAWDTKTDTDTIIWDGNISYPTVLGNYIYYMDVDNNYRLSRYNLSGGEAETLTEERLDYYNIYGNVIFYQTSDAAAPALMRMLLDGSHKEVVSEGVYHRINTTSAYTYFQPFGKDDIIYRTSTSGPIAVDDFPQAKEAAKKYQE